MNSQIRNILIFILIAGALTFAYFSFFKASPEESNLVSSGGDIFPGTEGGTKPENNEPASLFKENLISLLLSVESISLESSIFQNPAFQSLKDSSIVLIPPGNEGRVNPFAPIGSDPVPISSGSPNPSSSAIEPISAESPISDSDIDELENLLDL